MTTATLPASTGIVSSYSYDNADRLTGIGHVKDGSTTIASVSYTLDAVGNRTQRVDQQGTHTYAYDNLYRLTSVTYPGPSTTSYAFDAFGNRTSMTNSGGTTTYAYDDAERLTSVTPPSPAPVVNYTWDNNGNLTNRGDDSFAWDYEDRMTSATVNSVSTTFAHRGDGLRHSRTTGGNTTVFTWDVNAGPPVVLDDGNQYVYGAGLESMVTAGGTYYYLADGLGSTMAIVDTSGAVQKSYTYDVYGKPTATGSLANEFDFAGEETDLSTGLQYLRARYYDVETGAFASREPMAVGPGWMLNPGGYAAANPVRFSDPTGLWPGEKKLKKAKKAVTGAASAAGSAVASVATKAVEVVEEVVETVASAVVDAVESALPYLEQCAIWGAAGAATAAITGGGIVAGAVVGCTAGIASKIISRHVGEYWNPMAQCGVWGAAGMAGGVVGAAGGCAAGYMSGALSSTGTSNPGTQCTVWGAAGAGIGILKKQPNSGQVGAIWCAAGGLGNLVD